MSDQINHECGLALIRLLKPLDFYKKKYGTSTYGLNKLYLMLEKQHNRGQDGAGFASVKLDMKPGERFMHRQRSASQIQFKKFLIYQIKQLKMKLKKTLNGLLSLRKKIFHIFQNYSWGM